MTRGDIARLVALYVATIGGGTTLWIVLFHTSLLAGSVFFYRGLVLLAITAVLVTLVVGLLWRTTYRDRIGVRDILLIISLLTSLNVVFFTHVPVTADRSISVFLLAYMNRATGPLTPEQITDNVVQRYFLDGRAIEKRLHEQLVTGTLVRSADGYVISDEGRTLVAFYELIDRVFAIDPANLSP